MERVLMMADENAQQGMNQGMQQKRQRLAELLPIELAKKRRRVEGDGGFSPESAALEQRLSAAASLGSEVVASEVQRIAGGADPVALNQLARLLLAQLFSPDIALRANVAAAMVLLATAEPRFAELLCLAGALDAIFALLEDCSPLSLQMLQLLHAIVDANKRTALEGGTADRLAKWTARGNSEAYGRLGMLILNKLNPRWWETVVITSYR